MSDAADDAGDTEREARLPTRELLRLTAPYVLRYRARLLQATLLLLLVVGLGLVTPLLLGQIVDMAASANATGAGAGSARPLLLPVRADADGILVVALVFVSVVIAGFVLEAALGFLVSRVGVGIVLQLKQDLFRKVLSLDPGFFRDYPPGRLIARVESDTESLKNLFTSTALQLFRAILTFVGIVGMMLWFDARVTLFVVPVLVFLSLATMGFVRLVKRLYQEARRKLAAITAHVAESTHGIAVVQHYDYGPHVAERLRVLDDERYRVDVRASLTNQTFWGFFACCEAATAALVIAVGARQVVEGALTLGTLIVFLEYVRQAFAPVQMLSEFVSQVQQGLVSAGRVFGILTLEPAAPDAPDARPDAALEDAVRFEDVRFSYDGAHEVLRGVSFELPRGAQVALVGPSGGGKSTLVSLLLRFHEPSAGRITLDGHDLRSVRRDAWRRRVGLVLQDVFLFPGTLRDNLTVFDPARDPGDVERACRAVQAEKLLARLPHGLETELAERGANLSQGERQLVSLARALVHDPDLLVLDEATSAVDPHTEARIQAALERLLSGRTALIVAHRLATVRRCHEILVVEHGRIVERGSHDALWAKGGAYRRLARLQFPELERESVPPGAPAQVEHVAVGIEVGAPSAARTRP